LPYQGNNFALSYNFSGDSFLLVLNSASPATGAAEFENYLEKNHILNINWLQNLNQSYR
jgi:hypothetical protein